MGISPKILRERLQRMPVKRWLTFLRNHREAIAAMDIFTVPMLTFGVRRRDLLDHVIILNQRHLNRLMAAYLLYYHEDRTHLGLAKDTTTGRPTAIRSKAVNKIQSF